MERRANLPHGMKIDNHVPQAGEAGTIGLEVDWTHVFNGGQPQLVSAEARKESRGSHDRADFHDRPGYPNGRDDKVWMKHTLWYKEGSRLEYKPVHTKPLSVEPFEPKARVY